MPHTITSKKLSQLLADLGFERGEVSNKNHQIWTHPESGCTLRLPFNKSQEAARPADLTGVRAHLDLQGHLDKEVFDYFIAEGKLPAHS